MEEGTAIWYEDKIKEQQELIQKYEEALLNIKSHCDMYSPMTQGYKFTHHIKEILDKTLE